jgi:hypothetical protein
MATRSFQHAAIEIRLLVSFVDWSVTFLLLHIETKHSKFLCAYTHELTFHVSVTDNEN